MLIPEEFVSYPPIMKVASSVDATEYWEINLLNEQFVSEPLIFSQLTLQRDNLSRQSIDWYQNYIIHSWHSKENSMIQWLMLNLCNLPSLMSIYDHNLMKQQRWNQRRQNLIFDLISASLTFSLQWYLNSTYMWHSLLLCSSKHINAFSSDGRKVLQDPA